MARHRKAASLRCPCPSCYQPSLAPKCHFGGLIRFSIDPVVEFLSTGLVDQSSLGMSVSVETNVTGSTKIDHVSANYAELYFC